MRSLWDEQRSTAGVHARTVANKREVAYMEEVGGGGGAKWEEGAHVTSPSSALFLRTKATSRWEDNNEDMTRR